jgi:exodeoxyribonuclease VII large subunit
VSDDLFEWAKGQPPPEEARARPAPEPGPPAGVTVWTVAQLTRTLKQRIESEWMDVWVEGEAIECRQSRGSLWLKLKDGEAVLGAVIWPAGMRAIGASVPCDGDRVVCRGRIDLYPPKGEYRLVVIDVVQRGLGALLAARRALEEKLGAEGLLDPARKRRLPYLPRRVGLVTAAAGAALRDFLRGAELRFPAAWIVVAPARVQGEGAARTIVRALARLARLPELDVVVVARGGGSAEDLWAFNDEELARAIARYPVPVVSAVGHERDVTIADLVADQRAATPSAAAVAVFPNAAELAGWLGASRTRLRQGVARRADEARARIELAAERLARAGRTRLAADRRRLDAARARLAAQDPRQRLARQRRVLETLWADLARRRSAPTAARQAELRRLAMRLRAAGPAGAAGRRAAVRELGARLAALSPLRVLERGYAIVRTPAGGVVTDAAAVDQGGELHVRLRRGALAVRVTGRAGAAGEEEEP